MSNGGSLVGTNIGTPVALPAIDACQHAFQRLCAARRRRLCGASAMQGARLALAMYMCLVVEERCGGFA